MFSATREISEVQYVLVSLSSYLLSTIPWLATSLLPVCFFTVEAVILLTNLLDEAVALKSKGNELFVHRQFPEAAQEYSRIIDEYGLQIPADFEKVVLCNRAACDIELGTHAHPAIAPVWSLLGYN